MTLQNALEILPDFESCFCVSYQSLYAHVFHLIGTIGHVAHGKSTVVKALSGVHTVRFKNELERNITIKLGYANAKIFRSFDKKCQRPVCYTSMGSSKEDTFMMNNFKYELVSLIMLSKYLQIIKSLPVFLFFNATPNPTDYQPNVKKWVFLPGAYLEIGYQINK